MTLGGGGGGYFSFGKHVHVVLADLEIITYMYIINSLILLEAMGNQ